MEHRTTTSAGFGLPADNQIGILTGDILHSSQLNAVNRRQLEQLLWRLAESHAKLGGLPGDGHYEVTRGDSLQLRLRPERALEVALKLRLRLAQDFAQLVGQHSPDKQPTPQPVFPELDLRLAIGLGEESLRGRTLGSSDGSAYQRSGRKLDQMKEADLRLALVTGAPLLDAHWAVLLYALDQTLRGWSTQGMEAVAYRLQGYTYREIALQADISISSVHKRLMAAQWPLLEKTLDLYASLFEAPAD